MVYVLAIVAGLAGAAGGALAFWLAGAVLLSAFGLPESGGLAVLATLTPLGGAGGLVAGIVMILRRRGGFRTPRDLIIHSAAVLTLIAGAAGTILHLQSASLAHLGLAAHVPAVEFEIRLPEQAAAKARADAQVELRTDRNEALATLNDDLRELGDGRAVLKGQVPISFKTSQRSVVLNLPGQPPRVFKLRLAEQPKASQDFGPWHQVDFVAVPGQAELQRAAPTEGFAIRYRVI